VIKTPPSPLRLAALIGFVLTCVLVLTYLWISFGGSIPFAAQGYRIEVAFPQANELASGADVRIAGVNVGTVVGLKVDAEDSRTLATLQIERRYTPIPTDTRATLRIKTLLGETYVELSTGNRTGPDLPDGGRLTDGQVEPDVALDQILSTFDPTTRRAFETWMQGQAEAIVGRGADINASFGTLPAFVDSGESLLSALNHQSASVRGLVAHTGQFFNAISARRGQLSGLITAANSLFATTARRNQDLADVFKALPRFELESRLTLPALTAFAHRADPVVRALDPIAPQLTQSFSLADQLSPQLRTLFERLGPTVTASKRGLPALDRVLDELPPLLQAFGPFLRNADPIVRYIGKFKTEITGFFGNVTAASQGFNSQSPFATGKAIHYVRASQTLTPAGLAFFSRALGIDRNDAYRSPGVYNQLKSGLATLNTAQCSAGNPAPPTSVNGSIPLTPNELDPIPPSLVQMVQQNVFRTTGRNIAAPACKAQGDIPGFSTLFPQLEADAPPSIAASR
jgi:phospholipid/cholesterol/gamma-HCH transport system substrate-binding protein